MGQYGGNLWDVTADFGFEHGNAVMSVLQAESLVQFEVLLDMQVSSQVLDAHIMHVQVIARGHGPDAVKNILRIHRARHGVHHDVGVGKDVMYCVRHCVGHLF